MSAMGLAYGAPFGRGPGWSPIRLDPLQELRDSTLTDKSGNDLDADYAESPCASVSDGATLTVTGLTAANAVTMESWEYGDEKVTNGDFEDETTGWASASGGALEVIDGELKISGASGDAAYGASQAIPTVVGAAYTLSRWASSVGGTLNSTVGTSVGASDNGFCTVQADCSFVFVATSTTTYIALFGYGDGAYSLFDNISIKEITNFATLGTALPTASADTITFTEGLVYGLEIDGEMAYPVIETSGNDTYSVNSSWPDATFSANTWDTQDEFHWAAEYGFTLDGSIQIPALADGTADATGGEITNTKCGSSKIHNAGDYKVLDKSTSTALLDNPSLSADGITFDAKSFDEMRAHVNFTDNLIYCSTENSIIGRWAWTQETVLSDDDKADMLRYIEARGGD